VDVAKTLTTTLTVSIARQTAICSREDVNQTPLEYRLNRCLSWESQSARRHSGADVWFHFDW
jgi:hypothetical protein